MKSWKQNIKGLTANQYALLRELCYLSKNVYNESIYNIRQQYFAEGTYLRYEANYSLMKSSEHYKRLGASVAQQSMKFADQSFKSFFGLMEFAKSGKYESWKIKLPYFLKKDSLYKICFVQAQIKDGQFRVPVSSELRKEFPEKIQIKIPKYLQDKKIRQIHILPKYNGKFFEVVYMFDDEEKEIKNQVCLDNNAALSIDLGVNNLATCVSSLGDSFIIDGKKLKSINQWYNKENARLQSIKDLQEYGECTKRQYLLIRKKNRRIQNYVYCAAKKIVNYCIEHNIGNLVVGYNDGFQQNPNLGKVNNQKFVMIPFGKLKSRIEYLCKQAGINFIQQEESYTSKASFFDDDKIPKWNPLSPTDAKFSGKRITRGQYKTSQGMIINADLNAALNILKKSKLVDLSVLQCSGVAKTPLRIRI